MGRQAESQFGIEDGPVGQQPRRHHALLLGGRRRHDGDRRDLGARAGRRGHEQQRQALPLGEADTVDVVEAVAGLGQVGDEFGGVERRAATDGEHEIDPLVTAQGHGPLDDLGRRVGDHILEHGQGRGRPP